MTIKAPHFKFENNRLFYCKNIKDGIYKKWPIKSERKELILRAHLVGHLQENYYWKFLLEDVSEVVQQCVPYQRHHKVRTFNNRANATEITGIFDRIGIDIVLGLPVILVITDYLSKYPYAVPIKSKESWEIEFKLWTFITLFCPPKAILSDQGRVFCNQVVDQLLKLTGIERKVTSVYNPRTNGQTERFNKTLVESLRKHSEANPELWLKWIPYVLLAYRSRVHTSTAYSPYELLFGKKMNKFEDWQVKNDKPEDIELIRAKELGLDYCNKMK